MTGVERSAPLERAQGAAPSPSAGTLEELAAILREEPSLRDVHPERGEADQVHFRVLRPGVSPFVVVRVRVPKRRGVVWVSRLPGAHVPSTENDIEALVAFGVARIFCLVPTVAVNGLHGATRYLETARRRFGGRFHQIEIPDHRVPADDAEFEAQVAIADAALARGENVLVHCVGGCGRTGVFVACAMVRAGATPRTAISHFRSHRRCGPETPEQAAYVVRYARRLGLSEPTPTAAREGIAVPMLRLCADAEGRVVPLARGGLAVIHVGRLRVPGRPWKRVAVKRFVYPIDDAAAHRLQQTIDALTAAGVRLPKMGMHRLDDGTWVQVAQLFGSRTRGSKFVQPSGFHRTLSRRDRHFAADQLARVANAGHTPSIDLFLLFRNRDRGVVPCDLDLVVPEADSGRVAAGLVKSWIQLGENQDDRDELLALGLPLLRGDLAAEVRALLASRDGPYARLWRAL